MSETKSDQANLELMRAKLEAQKKDKVVHLLGGLVVGLVVGFFGANWLNSNPVTVGPQQTATASGELPHDHPPVEGGGGAATGAATGAAMPEVQEKLKRAEENPQDFDAQMEAAAMFHRINNPDRAIFYLKRAHDLKPDDFDTVVILANYTFDAKKFAEALPLYEKALKIRPDDTNVRTDLGTTQFELGNYDKAAEAFKKALEVNPKHEFALQNLAVVSIRRGDAATAEDALNRLSGVNPQSQALTPLRADLNTLKTTGKIPTH